jgi:predicted PurR-regulated permease PerM
VRQAVEDLQPGPATGGWMQRAVGSLVALAGYLTVVVFLIYFLLLSGSHFRRRIIEIAGPRLERRRITATIIDDINTQIQRFLLVRLVTSAIVALATWAVLAWMAVPQSAVWGILAGVVNSIPYFGPILVSGGLLVVGLTQSGDLLRAVEMSGAALVITSLEGWLLTPTLLGRTEHMHAVVVFLGLLVWTWIWGAWGTILAVPMLVFLKAIADHVDELKPVSRLMAP